MNKLRAAFILAVFGLYPAAFVFAQTTAESRSIDAYCKTVDAIQKRRKLPDLVFADTSSGYEKDEKAAWRKFASVKALDKFRDKSETYTVAYNWLKNGKVVLSTFTLSSPSGDWAEYINSYYREDGTLAKAKIDYRTFMGDIIVLQDLYFNSAGKQIKKNLRYQDLKTHKPKKVAEGSFDSSILNEVDYYMTTKKLPFANLMKK
jgi:hypothetical protein